MFQESRRIGETLRDVVQTLHMWRVPSEILLIDDGSTDGTATIAVEIAREAAARGFCDSCGIWLVRHPRNFGKGAAVRTGLRASRGEWVLMMDADNSTRLTELPKLATLAEGTGSGLVVGSRVFPGAVVRADARRRVTGFIFRAAIGAIGLGFAGDTQCGFKLYRRDAADLCVREGVENGFAFDLEHLGLCSRFGLGVAEVGVTWEHHDGGSIHVVRDGLKMLSEAQRIRRRLRVYPPAPGPDADQPNQEVCPHTAPGRHAVLVLSHMLVAGERAH